MDILTYLLIAIGLSFDSFAVSVSGGVADAKMRFWKGSSIAISLALFQGALPLLGWYLGSSMRSSIEQMDHWVAFALLGFIGGKMIWDHFRGSGEEKPINLSHFWTLIGVSIATSIDALVVGVSFGITDIDILLACVIIGITTYIAAMVGMLIGKTAAGKISSYANLLGGSILILIGLKILIEHTLL